MKSYKVLMVQPKTPQTFWTLDRLVAAGGFKALLPPLGLMTVAALMPDHYQVKILDLNTAPLDEEKVAWADLVFVTGMHIHRNSFVEVVQLAKKLGKVVVAGGPFASSESTRDHRRYGNLLQVDKIDHLVLYEAEANLSTFLQDFEQNKAKKVYDDQLHPDLSGSPPARYDLIRIKDYLIMPLQFSRGCPHDCEFCDIVKMFGRVPRTKSVEQFLGEMDRIHATGYRGLVLIVDDNFIGNRKAAKTVLPEIARWQEQRGYPFVLYTQTTLDLAKDDELLEWMVRAGFFEVFIGIETPDKDTLTSMHKTVNTQVEMDEAVEKIQRAGIEVAGGFIIGFDTDTSDIFQRQIDFIQRTGISRSMVGLLSPIPGTALYERLEKEERILDESIWKSSTGDNFVASLTYYPKMPVGQLLSGYVRVISEIYDPPRYFERSLTLISRLADLKLRDLLKKEKWRRRRALARTRFMPPSLPLLFQILRIFFSPRGPQFALFLARSSRYGLLSLSVAFDHALSGEHFFLLREKIRETLESK